MCAYGHEPNGRRPYSESASHPHSQYLLFLCVLLSTVYSMLCWHWPYTICLSFYFSFFFGYAILYYIVYSITIIIIQENENNSRLILSKKCNISIQKYWQIIIPNFIIAICSVQNKKLLCQIHLGLNAKLSLMSVAIGYKLRIKPSQAQYYDELTAICGKYGPTHMANYVDINRDHH